MLSLLMYVSKVMLSSCKMGRVTVFQIPYFHGPEKLYVPRVQNPVFNVELTNNNPLRGPSRKIIWTTYVYK